MASGFKSATVRASDVPASQTDFPSYVDLARVGITTLAEAQSVRVYADSGKVTEWAREIVSVSEMHVKVPSLTSTVTMYVDWDGVRADYAVGATYGRNNVWTGELAVWHLDDVNDSSGNTKTFTNENSCTFPASKIANGVSQGTSNTNKRMFRADDLSFTKTTDYSMRGWVKLNTAASGLRNLFDLREASTGHLMYIRTDDPGGVFTVRGGWASNGIGANDIDFALTMGTSNFYHLAMVRDGTTLRLYIDGVQQGSTTRTVFANGSGISNQTTLGASGNGFIFASATFDEVRYRNTAPSANWITTEYNNQNAESTFWGAWTTSGGGVSNASRRAFFQTM